MLIDEIKQDVEYKKNDRYQQPVKPSIYRLYKEYIASGQYPYIESVAKWIEGQLAPIELDAAAQKNLRTEVYICSQQHRKDEEAARQSDLAQQGYKPLTVEAVKEAGNRRLEIIRTGTNILGGEVTKTEIFKARITPDGKAGLLPKGARTKGFFAETLIAINAMYRYV